MHRATHHQIHGTIPLLLTKVCLTPHRDGFIGSTTDADDGLNLWSTVPQSSDSARVLQVHEAFVRVSNGNGGGNSDEEERKCGMLPKSIIMPILLMEACGKAVSPCLLSI
jgi:hypothetical protein